MTQTWHTSLLIRSEFPHKSLTSLLRSSVSSIPGFAHPHTTSQPRMGQVDIDAPTKLPVPCESSSEMRDGEKY